MSPSRVSRTEAKSLENALYIVAAAGAHDELVAGGVLDIDRIAERQRGAIGRAAQQVQDDVVCKRGTLAVVGVMVIFVEAWPPAMMMVFVVASRVAGTVPRHRRGVNTRRGGAAERVSDLQT